MKKATSISKYLKDGNSLDYDFLFGEAIRYLQNLSSETWTDYNVHDPGLTILEYLCYAMTDLAYRTDIDIEQIIYANPDIALEQALFAPEEIFPTSPVTQNDLRRLLMTKYPEIRNCWIEHDGIEKEAPSKEVKYFQLKTVYILAAFDDLPPKIKLEKWEELKKKIEDTLMKYRQLGEDFKEIILLERKSINISALITIQETYKQEDVMLSVLSAIEELLNPAVYFDRAKKKENDNTALAKIYEGPKQSKRKIEEEDLKERKSTLYWAEIQDLLLTLDGVLKVEELSLASLVDKNEQTKRLFGGIEFIEIGKKEYFYLDLGFLNHHETNYKTPPGIRLKRYNHTVAIDTIEVKSRFNYERNIKYRKELQNPPKQKQAKYSQYNLKELAQYTSIQQFFPHIYGLGKSGLPTNATESHQINAKQMKGYLLLFEHFFSSYLAELSELPFLYSVNSLESLAKRTVTDTAYKFFPFDIPDVDDLLMIEGKDNRKATATWIKDLHLASNNFFERKNRVLDHLLARFSESFDDRFHRRIYQDLDPKNYQLQLIEDKKKFLKDLVEIGYRRGIGFNYMQTEDSLENTSGIKKLICLKLGFPSFKNARLTNALDAGGIMESGKTIHDDRAEDAGINRGIGLRNLLYYGGDRKNYFIIWNDNKKVFDVMIKTPHITQYIYNHRELGECELAISRLQKEITEKNRGSLGFYMVEHILLRPPKPPKKIEKEILFRNVNYSVFSPVINGLRMKLKSKPHLNNTNALNKLNLNLLKYGRSAENWDEAPDGKDYYRLRLLGKEKNWVYKSEQRFNNTTKSLNYNSPKSQIHAYIKKLLPLTQEDEKTAYKKAIQILDKDTIIIKEALEEDLTIDISEFYQENVSFVMPNWVNHFFTKARRNYLEQIIRNYLPAHLTPCFYWLSVKEMKTFQDHFDGWQIFLSDNVATKDASKLAITDFLQSKYASRKHQILFLK